MGIIEAFVAFDTSKLRNAVAIVEAGYKAARFHLPLSKQRDGAAYMPRIMTQNARPRPDP